MSRQARSTALNSEALIEDLVPAEEALVRAAYRLIASKGIERTTLQDITDAAGVSKALAVYYFKTKENLLLAAIRWVLGRVATRMTSVVDSVETGERKVYAMVDAIFVDPRRNRDFLIRSGEGTVFVVDSVEEAAMGVRALIDGLFLQWLEESDWIALHGRYKKRCATAILQYLGVTEGSASGST
jgi:AcrR family transcriptional regulator